MNYNYKSTSTNYFTGSPRTTTTNYNLLFAGIQVKVDYHFATSKKLDPYVGLGGGLGYFFGSGELNGLKGAYPIYGFAFGLKSYGNKRNALLIELGYDSYSFLKVGYVLGKHK